MSEKNDGLQVAGALSPFKRIRRSNESGAEFWTIRDFVGILGYSDYRNFETFIEKARLSFFNSGYRIEDHFVDISEMVNIGHGAQQPIKSVLFSS